MGIVLLESQGWPGPSSQPQSQVESLGASEGPQVPSPFILSSLLPTAFSPSLVGTASPGARLSAPSQITCFQSSVQTSPAWEQGWVQTGPGMPQRQSSPTGLLLGEAHPHLPPALRTASHYWASAQPGVPVRTLPALLAGGPQGRSPPAAPKPLLGPMRPPRPPLLTPRHRPVGTAGGERPGTPASGSFPITLSFLVRPAPTPARPRPPQRQGAGVSLARSLWPEEDIQCLKVKGPGAWPQLWSPWLHRVVGKGRRSTQL